MKLRYLWTAFSLLFTFVSAWAAVPRDEEWRKVDQAVSEGLPQTAIEQLNPIIARALADKDYPTAIKALGRRIALEGSIQGNKPEEQIIRMNAALAAAPEEMRPMLEALVARWYWHYFQQNRWRFMQRTQTVGSAGPDFQSWDLPRILAEIDQHFTAALADEKALQATPISAYADLLVPGSAPDAYRPTVYDFLAHEALAFYQAGEHGAQKAETNFELTADSPVFADAAEFIRWEPVGDEGSPTLKAIRLYQRLLAFHAGDADRSAYYDSDLARLTFARNATGDDDLDSRYRVALERFIAATKDHEISARALAALADVHEQAGEPAQAHALAQRGYAAFPNSAGGTMCFNLIQTIEAKSLQIATEHAWTAPWPTLDVAYRNLTHVHFRAVPADFSTYVHRSAWRYGRGGDATPDILAATPILEWHAELPATTDYKERLERVPVPTTVKPGFYHILASADPTFRDEANQLSSTSVWVSDLALVMRASSNKDQPDGGLVVRASSGEPVVGAKVSLWEPNRRNGELELAHQTTTNSNGLFEYPASNDHRLVVALAESAGQSIASAQAVNNYRSQPDRPRQAQVVYFTDRALYRPGQTIQYKGICLQRDPSGQSYTTLGRRQVKVVLQDPNGEEVARADHVTNDYGSFSGTFTVPAGRATGMMRLTTTEGASGATTVSVEEYKRPKFEVELAAPAEAARLGALVRVTGQATAYTGAAIGGAKVKWRVQRGTQLPIWHWRRIPGSEQAIAHGAAVTAADGSFQVEFPATPDATVAEKDEPVFRFSITADVTDTSGETRSTAREILAGYTALQATLRADDWQTVERPVEFKVTTSSLDGDPLPATGTIVIQSLQQPAQVARAEPVGNRYGGIQVEEDEPGFHPANPDTWKVGDVVRRLSVATDATGEAKIAASLPAGIYRATLETQDRFGKKVTGRTTLKIIDPQATRYGIKLANDFSAPKWKLEPGETLTAVWGTGYPTGRAYVELERAGKILQSYWTETGRTQQLIKLPITDAMRGGVTLRVTYVRENRLYNNQRTIEVPWTNKQLAVKWESFRSKLLPGQKETWTAVVSGADAKRATAEMVATLYDASLDQFAPHGWLSTFGVFRQETGSVRNEFQNQRVGFAPIKNTWRTELRAVTWDYRHFPRSIADQRWGWDFEETVELHAFSIASAAPPPRGEGLARAPSATMAYAASAAPIAKAAREVRDAASAITVTGDQSPAPDLNQVSARRNLNETAFFFPHLLTDENGVVRMEFTMPEALTRWKFMAFAHDRSLRAGALTDEIVTSKDIMVQPNPPRFVREGDVIEFTVKVSNQTDQPQVGKVRLTFADAASLTPSDAALGNLSPEQNFDVPAKQSRSYAWRITVPEGSGVLTYKAVGATGAASDGEEGFLPVLSQRILVTESLPLPVRGAGTRTFDFKKLLASGSSETLRSQSLTVQMVSQPAWYAVMALPYLMEYPYECSEQVFNRLYANALSRHIIRADPKIKRVFDLWKNTPAVASPLQKNEDLKSVLLEETPWVREAVSESESRRNLGLLFDDNRLEGEIARALQQLSDQQLEGGLWPWFAGGRPSEYISLYITTGFGRLRHLGVKMDVAPAHRSLAALDAWMAQRHRKILEQASPQEYVPSALDALYLYGRSFFLADQAIASENQAAVDFFLQQSRRFWLKLDGRQSQAHLAIALQRFGDKTVPAAIMKSLKERSVSDPELGMFWRDLERSWWWYHAPIETQALMIEAFDEVARDAAAVEACQVWLLKQKQTQDWKTTKATADAIYALLLRGKDLLASDALVEVSLGGQTIKPEKVEAGTGFYEKRFVRAEIKPAMGHITVKKTDGGVSWGSMHWQYLEDMTKITPHEGTPLKLRKALFVKENTAKGPVLKPVTGPVGVGDELVVRIELRADRDMEYVHLKDQRGSGTEPVNVLSQYRYQDGLAYYESTRDTASHFFIDYLPKGTYVFEYSTRIQLRGRYQSGIAEIRCMYAPEFNSHSASFPLEVK